MGRFVFFSNYALVNLSGFDGLYFVLTCKDYTVCLCLPQLRPIDVEPIPGPSLRVPVSARKTNDPVTSGWDSIEVEG